jgi:hypothetical protein
MDKENVIYNTMGYYLAIKKNEIILFAGKWMDIDIIMLSEISHTKKDKFYIFSLM